MLSWRAVNITTNGYSMAEIKSQITSKQLRNNFQEGQRGFLTLSLERKTLFDGRLIFDVNFRFKRAQSFELSVSVKLWIIAKTIAFTTS